MYRKCKGLTKMLAKCYWVKCRGADFYAHLDQFTTNLLSFCCPACSKIFETFRVICV